MMEAFGNLQSINGEFLEADMEFDVISFSLINEAYSPIVHLRLHDLNRFHDSGNFGLVPMIPQSDPKNLVRV